MIFLMCLLCVLCQPNVTAFLLQPDHSSSSNASRQNFLSVQEFIAEKKELKHRIEQVEHDNEQTLEILTKQLKDKFSVLENQIKNTVKQNETQGKLDIFEIKFRGMEQNYTLLKQSHEVLQQKLSLQKSEITTLRKKSVELEKKILVIEQLKTINQSMDLHQIQNEMQQLQQLTSLLKRNQNARNQDFLALYNLTLMSDKKLQEQFENNQNLTNEKVFSIITNNFKLMENQLDMLTHELNASLTNVFSKMKMLSSQIGENSKKGNYDTKNIT